MDDLQPISATEQAAFCVELTKRLNMLRKQDHLCDVMHLSMLSPRVGGAGYPREFDIMKLSQGRDFDI